MIGHDPRWQKIEARVDRLVERVEALEAEVQALRERVERKPRKRSTQAAVTTQVSEANDPAVALQVPEGSGGDLR